MTKRKPKTDYFLYKEHPFRPLYMGGLGFRPPPTTLEKSLAPRNKFMLWKFSTRALARAMCAANMRPTPCSYAECAQFAKLSGGHMSPGTTIATTAKQLSLESLA